MTVRLSGFSSSNRYVHSSSSGKSKLYLDTIKSPRWKELRERLIAERGGKCQVCGRSDVTLQLHHVTYERLGNERDTDLLVVCIPCHKDKDNTRTMVKSSRSWSKFGNRRFRRYR